MPRGVLESCTARMVPGREGRVEEKRREAQGWRGLSQVVSRGAGQWLTEADPSSIRLSGAPTASTHSPPPLLHRLEMAPNSDLTPGSVGCDG